MNGWFANLSSTARKRWALLLMVMGLPDYSTVPLTLSLIQL